ncbi:MAG: hypothetical protein HC780_06025 [Leptolyngbyaceae cyanobacterium CSU_1_3]|nr:hypothetical protein [Leptolyngbyaceae cyanobacterium CSU_1_3]
MKQGKINYLTLRRGTLLIIGITLVSLNAAIYGVASTLLLGGSMRAEEKDTRQAMKGVLNVFNQNIEQFNLNFADWSSWDDAYQFIQDGNSDFIQTNLIEPQLAMLQVNLILFVDRSGKTVFSTGFDLEQGRKKPIPPSFKQHLKPDGLLLKHKSINSSVSGIVILPEGAMIIASRPISTSQRQGEIRGSLIVGRYLREEEVDRLTQSLQVPLKVHPLLKGKVPPELISSSTRKLEHADASGFLEGVSVTVRAQDEKRSSVWHCCKTSTANQQSYFRRKIHEKSISRVKTRSDF